VHPCCRSHGGAASDHSGPALAEVLFQAVASFCDSVLVIDLDLEFDKS
jgi:hypothetical protein